MSDNQKNLVNTVKGIFGDNVGKIIVGWNCEYNDEGYDMNGPQYVEVYNKKGKIMAPKDDRIAAFRELLTQGSWYSIARECGDYNEDYGWESPPNNLEIIL